LQTDLVATTYREPKKRMPIEKEKQLAEKFYEYIDKCAK